MPPDPRCPPFTELRGLTAFLALLLALVIYCLMGLMPMVPKRFFLPLTLFNPAAGLVGIPALIYCFDHIQLVTWGISIAQVSFGFWVLHRLQGALKFAWPLVPENRLEVRRFSWRNLLVFLLGNVLVVLPAVALYLVLCIALGVGHFSEGFLKLRPGGLTVQVRKYIRDDGKTVQLFPMAHIGDADFYRKLSESFPTNAIILMEGVTDERNLLTNRISYKRMATSLGLSEQQKEFKPQGEVVPADVDVEEFATNTIGFINMIMRVHTKGLKPEYVLELVQYSPPPNFQKELFDDLLHNRNRHLLGEIDSRLSQSDHLIVPWGVAHMPEVARGIQKAGFRLDEIRDFVVIRFGPARNKNPGTAQDSERP